MALTLWLVSRIQLCGILTDILLQAVVDPLDNGLIVLTLASQKTWNASSEIITTCNFRNDLHDICSKQKVPENSMHMYKLQQTVNSEQSDTPALAYWTTGSKSPRTSTVATLVPRASLLGTRLLCNNNNNKMHQARGACWFTIATSRSIAMTPFSSFGRTRESKSIFVVQGSNAHCQLAS